MPTMSYYTSPIGSILLASDGTCLVGSWFEGQKNYASTIDGTFVEGEDEIILKAKCWLDLYFTGKKPKIDFELQMIGTNFQKQVWQLLTEIPYGQTATYSEIASKIASKRGTEKMSARAVGAAIGKNPLTIFIPCHRIVGVDGKLTGYAGGIERKKFLIELENANAKF